ncbi:DUF3302 domain-containing protein [Agaribacterium sp. ZY112]|uniref:DUF3302 domain-containing protein n=1 Tax=Agaribacterium sp. ZY112 TaxID=3233574 RepID=UPI003525A551
MILDLLALIVLLVIVAAGVAMVVVIGSYPGKVALAKGHPQVNAITYMAWLGLLSFGLLWVAALIWAQINYSNNVVSNGKEEQA